MDNSKINRKINNTEHNFKHPTSLQNSALSVAKLIREAIHPNISKSDSIKNPTKFRK